MLFAAVDLEGPGVAGADQAVVSAQLGKRVRSPVALQIGWRRTQVHRARRDTGGDQSRLTEAAQADRQVITFLHQIQRAVGQFDLHPQLRVLCHEFVDQRHDEALAVGHRRGHAQQPGGSGVQVADCQECLVALLD